MRSTCTAELEFVIFLKKFPFRKFPKTGFGVTSRLSVPSGSIPMMPSACPECRWTLWRPCGSLPKLPLAPSSRLLIGCRRLRYYTQIAQIAKSLEKQRFSRKPSFSKDFAIWAGPGLAVASRLETGKGSIGISPQGHHNVPRYSREARGTIGVDPDGPESLQVT